MARQSWDDYFLGITEAIGKRGTCDRGRSGAIIVVNKRIVATGYVGSPPGMPHCDEAGHLLRELVDEDGNRSTHCIRTIHAEANAVLQAAECGTSVKGGVLYCRMVPCYSCAVMIVRVGLVRVVAMRHYHADSLSIELLKSAGVQLDIQENAVEKYERQ